jgi:hypothetical protein
MDESLRRVQKAIDAEAKNFLPSGWVEFLEELQGEVACKLAAARETEHDNEDDD